MSNKNLDNIVKNDVVSIVKILHTIDNIYYIGDDTIENVNVNFNKNDKNEVANILYDMAKIEQESNDVFNCINLSLHDYLKVKWYTNDLQSLIKIIYKNEYTLIGKLIKGSYNFYLL